MSDERRFTPGPWRWRQVPDWEHWELVGANDERIHDDGSAAAEYAPSIDVHGPDAQLIAAAPDLLDACIEAREALEGIPYTKEDYSYSDEIAKLDAAIAKALGRQP